MKKQQKPNFIYYLLLFFNRLFHRISSSKKRLIGLFLLGVISLFIIYHFRRIFFVATLTGIGALSLIHSRYFKYSHYIGFELCTMATVLVSLAYGPAFGAFTGFASIFAGFVLSGYFKPTYFISVLVMPLVGLIAPVLSSSSVPLLYIGLIATVLYDAIILPLYVMMGSRTVSSVVFFLTHILLNYWIFSTIAPAIYNLMV